MNRTKFICCAVFSFTPLLYLTCLWKGLPDMVPTHFDVHGIPNDYSPRWSLWLINGFMSALPVALYLLFNNMHRIDPKRRGMAAVPSFARLADGMILFLTALNFVMLYSFSGHEVSVNHLVFPLIGLLFVFFGNVMFSIKPNYFAGIRLPWTLSDDGNWRATHRVAGVVWFTGGLVLILASFLLPAQYSGTLLLILVVPMTGIPFCYSFWYYKTHLAGKE